MDFVFLPPEINSTRMYSGPGSGSLLAAASGWDSLAAVLESAAEGYESVLSPLTSWQWRGAASEAMAATAAQYAGWLHTIAQQTKQTARQASAAAAAYEHAYAMTVPPTSITANRIRLKSLIATNVVGQNTAAIAATEAQYAEYWAQDTAAMSGYASSAEAATQFSPFSSPNQTTNSDAQTVQNTAVAHAANSAGSRRVSQAVSPPASTLPSNPIVPDDFTALDGILAAYSSVNATYNMEAFTSGIIGAESNLGMLPKAGAAAAAPALVPSGLGVIPGLASATSSLGGGGAGLGNVTGAFARAGSIGSMSVPASWSAPTTSRITAFEPAGMTTIPGTDEAITSGYPGYPGIPAGTTSRILGAPPRYGARLTVMPRPPAAG
ncbi:PPE family protein [Mycobacterium sp. Aquia_216]|uniref:PPE family protein n=1 Tax=Mycobacterium sp. Aquia_216 TaxID=2991729 RepID=UPI00227BD7B8|nr:PPE family protein [Mycobacterium sp. Aquia_216]WAJ42831.1 PPE family protein [Mycobacterium sp. Aquia_216]